ncbi:hypothetical protein DM02DRAFT_675105 [Periconia macrospinosa]|uniref:Transmembrane protein n=1 Tax=Periconia macrospinosa TaxID=97972 RepID=A0A2V1DFN7_9PLEO|nr:hypothetical protein DM02DRAFT_675105 [Periconia macrospinosa]
MEQHKPYGLVAQRNTEDELDRCTVRNDDAGFWNISKTYSIFVLHLVACILFVISVMVWVDGCNFRPGSPPSSFFEVNGPLYQTQVNGLVSLALVFIRLLAACCAAPLIWTVILVLLEKRGMWLSEISRLNYLMPVLPRAKAHVWGWYAWATLVTVLLWPPNFASPIANSSLAWIPDALNFGANMKTMPISSNYDPDPELRALYLRNSPQWQTSSYLKAVVRMGSSPAYAFNTNSSRRYFSLPSLGVTVTNNSIISLPLPYIDVKIRWIDPSNNTTQVRRLDNTTYSDYVGLRSNGLSRNRGSVVVMREEPWDRDYDWPSAASKFKGERLIGVQVFSGERPGEKKNDTGVTVDSECPNGTDDFVSLPNVPRVSKDYYLEEFGTRDCYQVGIVTIEAGLIDGKDCNITLVGATDAAATCSLSRDTISLEDDWIAPIAVNMISEIANAAVTLEYTSQWLDEKPTIDDYVTGVLRLAYHAAWSSAMEMTSMATGDFYEVWRQAHPMVRAELQKSKVYAWFAMQLTITVAAVFVYAALRYSSVKFVRDTALTPLRLDLSKVTHTRSSTGLCNAVALSKEDRKLPMVKFDDSAVHKAGEDGEGACRRRIVFVDEAGRKL